MKPSGGAPASLGRIPTEGYLCLVAGELGTVGTSGSGEACGSGACAAFGESKSECSPCTGENDDPGPD